MEISADELATMIETLRCPECNTYIEYHGMDHGSDFCSRDARDMWHLLNLAIFERELNDPR